MYSNNNLTNKRTYQQQRSSNYNNQQSIANSLQLQSPFNIDPIKELETYKYEVDRLKK